MRKVHLFVFILSSSLLAACLSKGKADIQPVLNQAEQQLAAGDYQEAIDTHDTASQKYPGDPSIQSSYQKTLETIGQRADKAFEDNDYARAEKIYSILERNFPRFKRFEKSISFTLPSLSRRIRDCRLNLCQTQARQFLKDGYFEKGLSAAMSCAQAYPGDPDFSAAFKEIADELSGLAGKALAGEDYVKAGRAYQSLSKSAAFLAKMTPPAAYSQSSFEEGIKRCRTELTRQGLELYRQGKLAEAISIWEGLLSFDPDNVEIKKAVATAKEQLKKLKKD